MVEITSEEQNKVQRIKRTEDSLRDLCDNIKSTSIKNVLKPSVPKEEIMVGGGVESIKFGEGRSGATKTFADKGLHLVVDGLAHVGFLLVVGDGEIVAQKALQVLAAQVAVETYHQLG